jgi:hypothetical protein
LLRLRVFKRNGEKIKTHYKSQQQKTTTYHWAQMENTDVHVWFFQSKSYTLKQCLLDVIATKIIQRIIYISNFMLLLATAIKQFYFIFNMSLLILLSLVIFLSKRDFITNFFQKFWFFCRFLCFFNQDMEPLNRNES